MDDFKIIDDMADVVGIVPDDPFDDAANEMRLRRKRKEIEDAIGIGNGMGPGAPWAEMIAMDMIGIAAGMFQATANDAGQICCCDNNNQSCGGYNYAGQFERGN